MNDYNVIMTHHIITNEVLGQPLPSHPVSSDSAQPAGNSAPSQALANTSAQSGRGLSTRAMISSGSMLLAASGQQRIASTINEVSKYSMLGARAVSGDPTAALLLAVDFSCRALSVVQKWQEEERRKKIEARRASEYQSRYGETFTVAYRATV